MMKKKTGTWICSLAMMGLFLLIVDTGCKEEQNREWPEGLNGRFVLSSYDFDGNSIIYFMDENGVKRLLSMSDNCNSCGIGWVKWAPDGSRFTKENNNPDPDGLFVMNADGSNSIGVGLKWLGFSPDGLDWR